MHRIFHHSILKCTMNIAIVIKIMVLNRNMGRYKLQLQYCYFVTHALQTPNFGTMLKELAIDEVKKMARDVAELAQGHWLSTSSTPPQTE